MTTALVEIQQAEQALSGGVVTAGSVAAADIESFANRRLSRAERQSLADAGNLMRRALEEIERQRTEITKPLNDVLRTVNALFRKHSQPIDDALKKARAIESSQRTLDEQEERARVAREQAAAAAAAAKVSAAEDFIVPAATVEERPVENVTRGAVGSSVGRKQLVIECTDTKALANAYPNLVEWRKSAVERQLRALLDADPNASIPGVKHSWTTGVAFR